MKLALNFGNWNEAENDFYVFSFSMEMGEISGYIAHNIYGSTQS